MKKTVAILCLALITTNPALACEKGAALFFVSTAAVGAIGVCYSLYAGYAQECPSDETSWCCEGWTPCIQITRNESCGSAEVRYCGPENDQHLAPVVNKPWFQSTITASGLAFAVGLVFSVASMAWIYLKQKDQALKPMNQPLVNAVS